jgi:peptidoglycan hydrolase-like protein with peptidoglycan-binding domain
MKISLAAATALALLAPATAIAQAPPQPPPPAPPAAAKLALSLNGIADRGEVYVLKGSKAHVSGTLTPFVGGQTVRVALYRGHKKLGERRLDVKQKGSNGVFSVDFRLHDSGNFTVKAAHDATSGQAGAVAKARRLGAVSPGHGGESVRLLQLGLHRLGYVTPIDGSLGGTTRRALLAFRKVNKMARTGSPSRSIYEKVFVGHGGYHLRYPSAGKHVEANLERQVVVLADHGRAERIYHMSSGKPSTPTVRGAFRFYSKTPGFNSEQMYDSNYFIGGYAIHGYPSVPNYAASHGCIRVNNADAPGIFAWIQLGDRIFVY